MGGTEVCRGVKDCGLPIDECHSSVRLQCLKKDFVGVGSSMGEVKPQDNSDVKRALMWNRFVSLF